METHLNPELQAKVNQWAAQTGLPIDELIEDAISGYFDAMAQVQEALDCRYDDLRSGRVQPIDGEGAFARLIAKTEAQRPRSA